LQKNQKKVAEELRVLSGTERQLAGYRGSLYQAIASRFLHLFQQPGVLHAMVAGAV
jgi:hypothetical protein